MYVETGLWRAYCGEEVMRDVGVGDVVVEVIEDAKGAVHSGQRASQPVPLVAIKVRQRPVRVLQQRDQHLHRAIIA